LTKGDRNMTENADGPQRVLVLLESPRQKGNSAILAGEIAKAAEAEVASLHQIL